MRERDFRDLVIVADLLDEASGNGRDYADHRNLEQTESTTLDEIVSAANDIGIRTHHYLSPAALARHADRHRLDLVLSIYGGLSSRNRMAITPAVCEAHNLRFIGPDTYGRIIAQDKEISKRLAIDCGLRTPAWRVVRNEMEATIASRMSMPVAAPPTR